MLSIREKTLAPYNIVPQMKLDHYRNQVKQIKILTAHYERHSHNNKITDLSLEGHNFTMDSLNHKEEGKEFMVLHGPESIFTSSTCDLAQSDCSVAAEATRKKKWCYMRSEEKLLNSSQLTLNQQHSRDQSQGVNESSNHSYFSPTSPSTASTVSIINMPSLAQGQFKYPSLCVSPDRPSSISTSRPSRSASKSKDRKRRWIKNTAWIFNECRVSDTSSVTKKVKARSTSRFWTSSDPDRLDPSDIFRYITG